MFKKITTVAVSTLSLLMSVQSAAAFGPGSMARDFRENSGAQYLVAHQATLAPFAYVKSCTRNPAD